MLPPSTDWKKITVALGIILLVSSILYLVSTLIHTLNTGKITDYLERAQVAYQNEDYENAFGLYKKIIQLDNHSSEAFIGLGNVAYAQNAYEDALTFYQKADQNSPKVLIKIAKTHLQLPNSSLAHSLPFLDKALTLNPDLIEAKFLTGIIAVAQMDLEHAIKEIAVIEQVSSDLNVSTNSPQEPPLNLQNLTDIKQKLSTAYEQENNLYQKALVAHVLIEQNFPQLARALLQEILIQQESYRDAHVLLGATYMRLGEYQQAIEELNKASELDPNYAETFVLLGQTYEILGDKEKAGENFERAEKLGG